LSLVIEEKYDQVRTLVNVGKERGYLLFSEVKILHAELHSSEEIDDLLSTFAFFSGVEVQRLNLFALEIPVA
jgi:hypothetical protein